MRLLILALFGCLASSAACAQGAISATAPTDAEVLNRELAKGKGNLRANSVVGTSLLLPYWTRGRVKMTTGTVPQPWLKYDLNGDHLLWRRPDGDSLQLDTSTMTEFSLGDSLRGAYYVYRRYLTARIQELSLRTAFFEVRYDAGRTALLRRRQRVLFRNNNAPSLVGRTTDHWMETTIFYLKTTDNIIAPVRLYPKAVLAALGRAQAPALQAYITRENLDLRTETDVVKLLKYYDTL